MAVTDAQAVATYLIWLAAEHGDYLTNKKLQKLLYYCQGWYLAFESKPLFDEPIEAWIHGPVVRVVWEGYRGNGWEPLPVPEDAPQLHEDAREIAAEVLRAYGGESAYQLELRSHSEKPWQEARQGLEPTASTDRAINPEIMHQYFLSLLEHGKE